MRRVRFNPLILLLFLTLWGAPLESRAGVFSIPHFVDPGAFSLGIEPEINLESNETGLGLNLKYMHGVSSLINLGATLGTGGGNRGFRLGVVSVFDVFPDYEKQPGIGIALQGYFYRLDAGSAFEGTVIPYIHKGFVSGNSEFEPFLAFPTGFSTTDASTDLIAHVSIGSRFKSSKNLSFLVELGVAINNTNSYFSGGVLYFY